MQWTILGQQLPIQLALAACHFFVLTSRSAYFSSSFTKLHHFLSLVIIGAILTVDISVCVLAIDLVVAVVIISATVLYHIIVYCRF